MKRICLTHSLLLIATAQAWGIGAYRVHEMIQSDYPTQNYLFGLNNRGDISFSSFGAGYRYSVAGGIVPFPPFTAAVGVNSNGLTAAARGELPFALSQVITISDSNEETLYARTGSTHENWPVAINDNGFIVGMSHFNLSDYRAYVWSSPTTYALLPYERQPDSTYVSDINNSNRVVGSSVRAGQGLVPTYWDLSDPANPQIHYYQRYESTSESTYVEAINENGIAIGRVRRISDDRLTTIMWGPDGQIFHVIPQLSGLLVDINDNNVAVGAGGTGSIASGILYSQATGEVDLNTLLEPSSQDYHILWAKKINNRGEILAMATKNGNGYAVYLEPVPEPGTMAVLGLGLLTLMKRRKR